MDIIKEPEDKIYRISFFKRHRLADNSSVPFGYISEGRGVMTSVMSHDLRFKHPFSCIVAGPSGSGKSSFCIKLLQNIKTQCTEPEFAGGILWCYGEKNEKPSPSPSLESGYSISRECLKTLRMKEADRH
jgi:ABC-type microcin C transport system duplicated ATPase subunit YejF